MKKLLSLIAALTLLSAANAFAQSQPQKPWEEQPLTFSIGVSTAGPKAELQYRFNDFWAARGFVGGGITVNFDVNVSDNDYEGTARLGGSAIMADFYPFRGNFRLTGGVFYADSIWSGSSSGVVEVNGQEYAGRLDLDLRFKNNIAPMISAGYEWRLSRNFLIAADIGAIYVNGIAADLSYNGQESVDVIEVLREAADIQEPKIPLYPFVSLNVAYVF